MGPAVAKSDEELMLRLRAGEEEAFDVLVGKYRAPVIHFLYRLVHRREPAEDLAQEVFLRVYRARKSYRPTAKFSTWLFRIATNVALNALRDGRMRHEREMSIDADAGVMPLAERLPDAMATAEQALVERERRAAIRRAVDALPEKQRLAVLLHKYQEMDYAEIAEVLEISESALKSLLFRAYETLRARLKPLLGVRA
jgi:RNA polymerase sigma-70 factor (ECF subfamily)